MTVFYVQYSNNLRRHLVFKLKIIGLALPVLVLLISSCQYITGEMPEAATTPSPAANVTSPQVYVTIPDPTKPQVVDVSQLQFLITISASPAYLPGEPIMFGIGISNLSLGTIIIDPFPAAMRIKSLDRNEIVYSEPAGNRTRDISADSPFTPNKDTWDQKDDNGQQVVPGSYEISYEYVIIDRSTSKKYTDNPSAKFKIADPDSAVTKDISVNQTVTNTGLAVTLNRLELNAVSGKASTFYNPPGFTVPDGSDPLHVEGMAKFLHGSAEYSIDGGNIKQITTTSSMFDKSGITIYWVIDPVSLNAKELTFTVTNLGGVEGRWDFKIPLE
jgi:hypothetical protein